MAAELVWVSVRSKPVESHGKIPFHARHDCYRRQKSQYPRIPTVREAAVKAGLVPCKFCDDA